MTLDELRAAVRSGHFRRTTSGLCPDRIHANLVVLPRALASDFRRFCELNPRACPLIEQTLPGEVTPRSSAPAADLRTDVPLYRIYEDGALVAEVPDIVRFWRDDLVSFLLGCSFNFESALTAAGIAMRHQEEGKVVPMYVTNRSCRAAGAFSGPLVVSMRPIHRDRVADATAITARYPGSHGAPIHAGSPRDLGIEDVARPDYGDAVSIRADELPVFWACGVTPQAVAERARPELLISHAPGHMFITDLPPKLAEEEMPGS